MKRGSAVTVAWVRRGSTARGAPGLFGRASVRETGGRLYLLTFSRLDGEDVWYADSMWVDGIPHFDNAMGERRARRHVISGYVEKAIDAHVEPVQKESA